MHILPRAHRFFSEKKLRTLFMPDFFSSPPKKRSGSGAARQSDWTECIAKQKTQKGGTRAAEILTRQRWAKREQFKLRKNPDSFANTVNGRMDSYGESIRPPVQEA